jgi:hypothetical protein
MIFATVAKIKKLIRYSPKGSTYPIGRMPMRKYWDAIEPSVYLTLFAWLAPIKEGRSVLQDFAAKADAAFAQPTYLAYVVLTPVKKIVGHLIDICFVDGIVPKAARTQSLKINKLRHQTTAYIARQYLNALILASGQTDEGKEDKALSADDIGKMQGVTRILLNLPREYQRWNKYYGKEGKSIQPKKTPTETASGVKNNSKTKKQKPDVLKRPFDVTCKIHESFKYCTTRRLKKHDHDCHKPLQLGKSWDPLTVTQGLLDNKYDITVSDMNTEAIEDYLDGEKVDRAARGNTADKKREISDQESGTNTRAAKRQKTTDETEQDVKQIICNCAKNHISTIHGNTNEILLMCNDLTKNLMAYLTEKQAEHSPITLDDIQNATTADTKEKDKDRPHEAI